jgi:NADPH:quinone reductase-like Zn-dependent oxidoreductase
VCWNALVALVLALSGGVIDVAALRGLVMVRRLFVGSRASFEAMNGAIEHHKLHPVIDRSFPFRSAREADTHFAARKHVGKVLIADRGE